MPDDDHDVGVAGLADRLSVVQGLDDRDQATVLLDVAGQAVQVASSLVAAQLAPRVVSCSGSFDSLKNTFDFFFCLNYNSFRCLTGLTYKCNQCI